MDLWMAMNYFKVDSGVRQRIDRFLCLHEGDRLTGGRSASMSKSSIIRGTLFSSCIHRQLDFRHSFSFVPDILFHFLKYIELSAAISSKYFSDASDNSPSGLGIQAGLRSKIVR